MGSTTLQGEMLGVFSQKQITGCEQHLNVPVSSEKVFSLLLGNYS